VRCLSALQSIRNRRLEARVAADYQTLSGLAARMKNISRRSSAVLVWRVPLCRWNLSSAVRYSRDETRHRSQSDWNEPFFEFRLRTGYSPGET
jgi:hypothetical protein